MPLLKISFVVAMKRVVAILIGRVPLVDLAQDELVIVVVVEVAPGMVKDAVERVKLDQLEVIFAFAPYQLPKLVEQPGRGDHGRAAVKLEAVLLVNVGTAAQLVALFQHRHIVPALPAAPPPVASPPNPEPITTTCLLILCRPCFYHQKWS